MEEINLYKIDTKISEFRLQMQAEDLERNKRRNLEGIPVLSLGRTCRKCTFAPYLLSVGLPVVVSNII